MALAAALGGGAGGVFADEGDWPSGPLDAINFEAFATNHQVTLPAAVTTGTRDDGTRGNAANIVKDEDHKDFGSHFFVNDLDNASKVVAVADETGLPALPAKLSLSRPSYYTNSEQKAVLHVETGNAPLYRAINWVRAENGRWKFDPYNDVEENDDGMLAPDERYLVVVPTNGVAGLLYFDSLVKFSVVPDGALPQLTWDEALEDEYGEICLQRRVLGKLLVYVNAFDTVGDPSNPDDYEPGWTNICAVGGRYNSDDGCWETSIYTNVTENFRIDPNAWHRLTIRAASIEGDTTPLFEIYVDATNADANLNQPLKFDHMCCSEDELEDGIFGEINEGVKGYLRGCTMIAGLDSGDTPGASTGQLTFSGVGFRGEGYLDDYVVTRELPHGISQTGARIYMTLYWTPASCLSSIEGGEDELAYFVNGYKHDCDTDASQTTFEVQKGQTVSFAARARNFGYYAIVPEPILIDDLRIATNGLSAVIEMGLSNYVVYVDAPEGFVLSASRDGVPQDGMTEGKGKGLPVPSVFSGTVTNEWAFESENRSASPFIRSYGLETSGFTETAVTNGDSTVTRTFRIASAVPTVAVGATFVENAGEVLPAFAGLSGFTVWDWLRTTGVDLLDIKDNNISAEAQQASYLFGTDMLGEMPVAYYTSLEQEGSALTLEVEARTNNTPGTVSLYYFSDDATKHEPASDLRGYLHIIYTSNPAEGQYKVAPWVLPELLAGGRVRITTREYEVVQAGFYSFVLSLKKLDAGTIVRMGADGRPIYGDE